MVTGVSYTIETYDEGGSRWTDAIGDSEGFETRAEAIDAINGLRAIDDDWANARYRILRIVGTAPDSYVAGREEIPTPCGPRD